MRIPRKTFIVTISLAVIAAILFISQRKGTLYSSENQFAVSDTASITKIFFADKNENTVKLVRHDDGSWSLNDKFQANRESVNTILKTFVNIDVKMPVAKAARNNILRLLAAKSVKTEIYQRVYRIDLFNKIRLFPHEKKTMTYYVGDATMDNRGTFMIMEGSEDPYIVYIPGFRGFVSTRYSARLADWRDHTIFNLRLPDIASVSLEYGEFPNSSFSLQNSNNRNFVLNNSQGMQVKYDTLRVISLLGSFSHIAYENPVDDLTPAQVDSVKALTPFVSIKLKSRTGNEFGLQTWRKKANEGDLDMNGQQLKYDADRLYAYMGETGDFVTIQYFVFDKIFIPLEWLTGQMNQPNPQ